MRQHPRGVLPGSRWGLGWQRPAPGADLIPRQAMSRSPLWRAARWVVRSYAVGLAAMAMLTLVACGTATGAASTPVGDQNVVQSTSASELCAEPPASALAGSGSPLPVSADESTSQSDRDPRVQIVVDLDATSSYRFFVEARDVATANLKSLLRPGFPGADVFVLLITSDSYGAEQLALDLPAVPLPPTLPLELVAPEQPNEAACDAFDAACRKRARLEWESAVARCKALNERRQSEYSAAALVYQAAYAAVSAQFDTELRRLANLQVAVDETGTDPCGLAKAAELLARGAGERWLAVASDWDFNDARCSDPDLSGLAGVRIQAFFFQCALADVCKARRDHWTEVFQRVGALGVRWWSPVESYNAAALFEVPR